MVGWCLAVILDSIVVSIPACHAGDRGSIPRRGDNTFNVLRWLLVKGIIPRKHPLWGMPPPYWVTSKHD